MKEQEKIIPPTVKMVQEYCESRKNRVDPETFFDFYESKGWKVGKNKMVNWQAAVRTWEKSVRRIKSKSILDIING
jgi:non-homologous end joining protein Ku